MSYIQRIILYFVIKIMRVKFNRMKKKAEKEVKNKIYRYIENDINSLCEIYKEC